MFGIETPLHAESTGNLQQALIEIRQELERRNGLLSRGTASEVDDGKMPVRGQAIMGGSTPGRPAGLTLESVDDAFRYHPWDRDQQDRGEQVREALTAAAKVILRVVPTGADRSTAIRKLREARMDANSAITHNGRF